jgi:hypothetical protein
VGWSEVLDDMELRLVEHDRALRDGTPPPPPLEIPPGIGPLPAELRERAEAILAATQAAARRVAQARDSLVWAMRGGERVETRQPAAYLDRRV